MANWENEYKTFPWHEQDRAYSLNCFNEGDIPRTPITGGPLTKTGTCDAIAVMVIYFQNSDKVKNGIFKVLKDAGASPTNTDARQISQSSLREMARALPTESYLQVKTELLALCEELLQENNGISPDIVSVSEEKLGLWDLIRQFFKRLFTK